MIDFIRLRELRIVVLILLAVLQYSCQKEAGSTIESVDSFLPVEVDFSKVSDIPLSDLVHNYRVVPLETAPNSITTRIVKLLYSHGRYYLLQERNKKILIFNEDGSFIREFESTGKGPGEYLAIGDFAINPANENITIVDPGPKKIIEYSIEGEFLGSHVLEHFVKRFSFLDCEGGTLVLTDNNASLPYTDGINHELFLMDAEYNTI